MQKRSDKVLELLGGGETLREARLKALKITKEIQGFGSTTPSPSSASSSDSSRSFGSYFSSTSSTNNEPSAAADHHKIMETNPILLPTIIELPQQNYNSQVQEGKSLINEETLKKFPSPEDKYFNRVHIWNCPPVHEKGSLLDSEGGEDDDKSDGLISGICSKLVGISTSSSRNATAGQKVTLRTFSDAGKDNKTSRLGRQYSLG